MIESTVVVKDDKGEIVKKYTLNVEIEMASNLKKNYKENHKPYLGGLKNGRSGNLLHHAFA